MLSAILLTHVVATSAQDATQEDPLAKYKINLIPVGKMAPNFTVKNDTGVDFDLKKDLKKSKAKATIINFWFST